MQEYDEFQNFLRYICINSKKQRQKIHICYWRMPALPSADRFNGGRREQPSRPVCRQKPQRDRKREKEINNTNGTGCMKCISEQCVWMWNGSFWILQGDLWSFFHVLQRRVIVRHLVLSASVFSLCISFVFSYQLMAFFNSSWLKKVSLSPLITPLRGVYVNKSCKQVSGGLCISHLGLQLCST